MGLSTSVIAASIGPGIIIPLVLLGIAAPAGFVWAKRLKAGGTAAGVENATKSGARLTSGALRGLPVPTWRVIYEITEEKLGGVEHVLIGPAGVFAVQTSMEALPPARTDEPTAHEIAGAAILRGGVDDALRRCAMTSDQLVTIHWGIGDERNPPSVDVAPGAIAVDGRSLTDWAASFDQHTLTPAQVDLAWQTITTAIGRPDPLI
jgi:hypothetical protein